MPRSCWARFRVIGSGEGFSTHEPVADTNQTSEMNACFLPSSTHCTSWDRSPAWRGVLGTLLQGTARHNIISACHVVGGQVVRKVGLELK